MTNRPLVREGWWRAQGYRIRFPEEGFVNIAGQDHAAFIEIMKRAGAEIVFDGLPYYYIWNSTSNPNVVYGVALPQI